MSRDWLRSFTIWRQSDSMTCHVWLDGGSMCMMTTQIKVPQDQGGSHRSVADYVAAAKEHLEKYHPKEYAMQGMQELIDKYITEVAEAEGRVADHMEAKPANMIGAALAQAVAETLERVIGDLKALP